MQTAEQHAAEVIHPGTLPTAPAPLVVVPPAAPSTMTSRAALMRAQIDAETEIRALIREYVNKHMVEGIDYGVIPGTDKPTLLKPGAEKLVDLFSVEPVYEVTTRIEDWDKGLFHYEMRVRLQERTSGIVRAEGMGSANSREGRYRWRKGERTCPSCGAAAIIKGKEEYGGGFLCFAKRGGCGAKFKDRDPAILEQVVGKVENDDIFTLVNTVLKMAKKRTLVDGAIALARCSDIFTQDVEDIVDGHEIERPAKQPQQGKTAAKGQPQQPREPKQPKFSKSAKWEGAEQWGGKPLADGPLDTLTLYWEAASAALSAEKDERVALLLAEHVRDITAAIAAKEPKVEREPDPDPTNGADTAADHDPGAP
jgi:hypothetical protein